MSRENYIDKCPGVQDRDPGHEDGLAPARPPPFPTAHEYVVSPWWTSIGTHGLKTVFDTLDEAMAHREALLAKGEPQVHIWRRTIEYVAW